MVFSKQSQTVRAVAILISVLLILPTSVVFGQDTNKDYYYEGQAAAEMDYTGSGAMVGGLASGVILGLIGWGIGYLVVSSQNPDVPRHYTSSLTTSQRMKFEAGYKDYVKKVKKGKFNLGAGIGTAIAVVLVLSSGS